MLVLRLLTATIIALSLVVLGCGEQRSGFGDDAQTDGGALGYGDVAFADTNVAESGCTNLQCQQTCASTSISGTVYDPAGENGLYNVLVYVPNAPLAPFTDGPTCTQCQAPASGSPIATALTDAHGRFSISNAPIGANIPLVLQIGKWRRHLTIPTVTACIDNPQPDKSLRLPRKQHETSPDDNIPLIAMTTGCDGVECFFLRRIGIDQSEFTDATGTGRVHLYISTSPNLPSNTFGSVTSSAWTLWTNNGEMLKYDMIFNACECNTYDRGGAGNTDVGYKNFLGYLNAGGRAFATHYYYNLFATSTQCNGDTTCQGQDPLPSVGAWEGNTGQATTPANCPKDNQGTETCLTIDTGIPKGKAFADWYAANNSTLMVGGGESYGYVGLVDVRQDMGKLDPTLLGAGTATPWLFAGNVKSNYDAYYFSFNTPVGTDPSTQCGRAIFSDVHVAESVIGTFPGYCAANANDSDHAPNELALEFLFFDLTSCIQNDTQPPTVPN